jgi:hypothetical protein
MASFALSKAGFVLSVSWWSISCKVCRHSGEKPAYHYNSRVMKQIFLLKNCSMVKYFQDFNLICDHNMQAKALIEIHFSRKLST